MFLKSGVGKAHFVRFLISKSLPLTFSIANVRIFLGSSLTIGHLSHILLTRLWLRSSQEIPYNISEVLIRHNNLEIALLRKVHLFKVVSRKFSKYSSQSVSPSVPSRRATIGHRRKGNPSRIKGQLRNGNVETTLRR